MNPRTPDSLRRWLGWSSLAFVGLNVLFLVLVFAAGSPPPHLDDPKLVGFLHDHAALFATVTLISYLSLAPFAAFVGALRSLIRDAMPSRFLADVVLVLGVSFTAIAFVDFGMMGVAQANAAGNADPATVRILEELGRYVGNVPSALEWAMLMVAASAAFWLTGILPRWVAWVGWIGAGVVLLTSASLYVGDTNSFFAADGGIALLGLLPLVVWMVCLSISVLRGQPATVGVPSTSDRPATTSMAPAAPSTW